MNKLITPERIEEAREWVARKTHSACDVQPAAFLLTLLACHDKVETSPAKVSTADLDWQDQHGRRPSNA